ncbi:hypothetical protein VP01_2710g3 [Puccinia sorghi]|uniref:Uncharacterized protein n=1 Tax=Puccinia sorghi TaxID=27349 RepID=A0A0L6V3G5_9BASI|nr:hypothetical protein VP01_2710g3 [Puccinia sorghi]
MYYKDLFSSLVIFRFHQWFLSHMHQIVLEWALSNKNLQFAWALDFSTVSQFLACTVSRNLCSATEDCKFMIQLVCNQPGHHLSLHAIHNNLVNQLFITLYKAGTLNIRKCLVTKYAWIECMKDIPAKFLVFTGILLFLKIYKSAVCDWELLCTFARSLCVLPSQKLIIRKNPKHLSIFPEIGLNGPLAILGRAETHNSQQYKHFSKYNLNGSLGPPVLMLQPPTYGTTYTSIAVEIFPLRKYNHLCLIFCLFLFGSNPPKF